MAHAALLIERGDGFRSGEFSVTRAHAFHAHVGVDLTDHRLHHVAAVIDFGDDGVGLVAARRLDRARRPGERRFALRRDVGDDAGAAVFGEARDDDAAFVGALGGARGRVDRDDDPRHRRRLAFVEIGGFDQFARPQGAGRVEQQFGFDLLAPEPRALIFGEDFGDEGGREIGDVGESRTARRERQRIGEQIAHQFRRARRGRHDRLRPVAETQAEHRMIPGFRITPGREFVRPQFHVLAAAQPLRRLGREKLRARAVRPFETKAAPPHISGARRADRSARRPEFALDHHLAHVVGGGADDVDEAMRLDPAPDGLGAGAGLAHAATAERNPIDPVALRDQLFRARPELPKIGEGRSLLRRQRRDEGGALRRRHPRKILRVDHGRRLGF